MIWNERLKIGVKEIDEQHEELFMRFNSLLETVRSNNEKELRVKKIIETLDFLTEYVVIHFDAEEKLQNEMGYPERVIHQKLHEKFKNDVIVFKTKLTETNFDEDVIQWFTGKLSAWLINHVADDDQHIADFILKKKIGEAEAKAEANLEEMLYKATQDVVQNMLGISLKREEIETYNVDGSLTVKIRIIGDVKCEILFSFSKETALEIVEKMVGMEIGEVDVFVSSAVQELSNIISGNFAGVLAELGKECDITTPEVVKGINCRIEEGAKTIVTNTDKGVFSITIA